MKPVRPTISKFTGGRAGTFHQIAIFFRHLENSLGV
jgi:hypothetical protein